MIWQQVESHGNSNYVNVSLSTFQDDKKDSLLNFTATSNVTILKYMGTFKFLLPQSDNDKEYRNQVLQSSIDLCKIHDGVRGNFLVKMMMEDFYNKTDAINLRCPSAPGTLNLKNFKVTDSFIPSYLIVGNFKFLIYLRTQAKIPNIKHLQYLYSLKFYGEIKKDS